MSDEKLAPNTQIDSIEAFCKWLKTCSNKYNITSMQGGFMHVKFLIEEDKFQ